MTEYYGLAVAAMRAHGRRIDDEVLPTIFPAHSENVNFFGSIRWTSNGSWRISVRYRLPATAGRGAPERAIGPHGEVRPCLSRWVSIGGPRRVAGADLRPRMPAARAALMAQGMPTTVDAAECRPVSDGTSGAGVCGYRPRGPTLQFWVCLPCWLLSSVSP